VLVAAAGAPVVVVEDLAVVVEVVEGLTTGAAAVVEEVDVEGVDGVPVVVVAGLTTGAAVVEVPAAGVGVTGKLACT